MAIAGKESLRYEDLRIVTSKIAKCFLAKLNFKNGDDNVW